MNIHFPPHLRRFIDVPIEAETDLTSLPDIIRELDEKYPGVAGYLVHENGRLRQHVNIFLDQRIVVDRLLLSDNLDNVQDIFFMQALSGG